MVQALTSLYVLEILRVGLAGLCFLLALLAFWLIQREQQRSLSPRKRILQAIYTFMSANFLSAVLVVAAGLLMPQQSASASTDELHATTYLTDQLVFFVDFTKRKPEVGGPVEITRVDAIHKISSNREDYVIPYFTTGDRIDAQFLAHPYLNQPEFVPDEQPDQKGKHYIYRIAIADQPKEFKEPVSTMFTFSNGFQSQTGEWWQASVAYPSKVVSVTIRFPHNKRCKNIEDYKIEGIGNKQPLKDNEPIFSNDGTIVQWTGVKIDGKTRIGFSWDW